MSESIEELKTCKACGKEKSLSMFYFKKDRNDYSNKCKKCDAGGIEISKSKTHKKCKHCGEIKMFNEFNLAGKGKWLQPYCRSCDCKRKQKFYLDNIDERKLISKEKYDNNKVEILKKQKEKRDENKKNNPPVPRVVNRISDEERRKRRSIGDKKYRDANIETIKSRKRDYTHSEHGRLKAREWQQSKKGDIGFITKKRFRGRIYVALKRGIKSESTENLLGCSIDYFKSYFESLFTKDMSWEKYLSGEMHIDHKRPCKLFDLTNPNEQKACFHYSNLQPLFGIDNLIKGSKYEQVL